MKEPRTLLNYRDLSVEVETSPGKELKNHMNNTVLGQPGSFRYRHLDLDEKLNSPGENYFMYLRKSGKMVGSVGFVGRHSETGGLAHDSWMIRFFSIKAPMRSVSNKRKEKEDLKDENKRTTVLGRFIQPVFADPSKLRLADQDQDRPAIIYALIDQQNLRSLNFGAQMGLETVGQVITFSLSRMQPRSSDRIEKLQDSEKETMVSLLSHFYKEYTLFFTDPLFRDPGYYVIKEKGRIVVGVQLYPVSWQIVDFGSGLANQVVRFLVKFPWVKRRINPSEVKLLAFDGIYCEPGYETALYELMEGVLELTGRYVAMLMMDQHSGLYGIFRDRQKLGILHKVIGSFHADVMVRFINIPKEVRQKFLKQPTYIPTYDNS